MPDQPAENAKTDVAPAPAPDPAGSGAASAPAEPAGPAVAPAPGGSLLARALAACVSATVSITLAGVMTAVVAGLAIVALVSWLLFTETGNRQILERLPGVTVSGMKGTVWGEFGAERVTVLLPNRWQIVIEQLRWRGLAIEDVDWTHRLPMIRADSLRARQVRVIPPEKRNPNPVEPPPDLVLPFGLRIGEVVVDEVQAPGLAPPLEAVRTGLVLGAGAGARHRLSEVSLLWDRLRVGGALQVGADAPIPLTLGLSLAQRTPGDTLQQAWSAEARAEGTLTDLAVDVTVRARDQALDLSSRVAPFAAMPLDRLEATARDFDLQALLRSAPRTALSGTVKARLAGRDAATAGAPAVPAAPTAPAALASPASSPDPSKGPSPTPSPGPASALRSLPIELEADLRNARAAAWSDGGIPVRSLVLKGAGDALDTRRGTVERLRAELGSAAQSGGLVEGSLRWRLDGTDSSPSRSLQLVADARLAELRPQRVDPRAPALQLSGPLSVDLMIPLADNPAPLRGKARGQWRGRLESRADLPGADLEFDLEGQARDLAVKMLKARAAESQLEWSGRLWRDGSGDTAPLQVAGSGRFQAFDPRIWWPGAPDNAWRRSAQRYSGTLALDLGVPLQWDDTARALGALRGQADLQLSDASFAGLGASGSLQLKAPEGQPVDARAQVKVAGADLSFTGQIDRNPAADATGDNGTLRWQIPDIAALAPWLALAGVEGIEGLEGDTQGELAFKGRGTGLGATGTLGAQRLRLKGVEASGFDGRLSGGVAEQAPWQIQATLQALALGADAPRLRALALSIDGSRGRHQISARTEFDARDAEPAAGSAAAAARVEPPAGSARAAAAQMRQGRVSLLADGGLQRRSAGNAELAGWQWRGEASQLDVGPLDTTQARWLGLLQRLPVQAEFGGGPPVAEVGPARITALDGTLRLTRLRYAGGEPGQPPSFALNAALEPLAIAPLLERWQPGFGWQGDLAVQARVDLAGGPAGLQGDLQISRARGDLILNEPDNPAGPMPLGLSELAVDFSARGGRWRIAQRVAGAQLGVLRGEQTVEAPAQALWPPDEAPVRGQLDLEGVNLASATGRWIPPGWRVAGEISTRARMTGRFGAPEFTGELIGRNVAVRNTAQGVDWSGADLRVTMSGAQARIERFVVQAGDGSLSVTGTAALGEAPRADLKLVAQRFAALQRVDRRVVASGEIEASIDASRLALSGQLRADEGRIDISRADAPSLGDDVVVRRADVEAEATSTTPTGSTRTARTQVINLRLDLGEDFKLRGRGVDTRLVGQARLTSPANRLQLNGTIEARDGTYAAYGQNLEIDRGLLIFTGPLENPRLDIEATRSNLDIRVGVAITGTAINPRVRLFSEPEMADTDKLSWLVLGRAPDGLARTDLALLQRAAYALVSGESESVDLVKAVGLDELSVRQGDGEVRETVVTLGKQLSRRWYVGYERSLNATTGTWQLIYRAAQRFTLRAQSGSENSLDLIWTWLWD